MSAQSREDLSANDAGSTATADVREAASTDVADATPAGQDVEGRPVLVEPGDGPADEPRSDDDRRGRRRRRSLAGLLASVPYVIAALVATAAGAWTYRPWRFKGTFFAISDDPLAFYTWVQATIEDGWYENATRLSAPYEMNSHSYTVTDEFLFAFIGKVLAPLLGGSAGAAVMVWVILSFPLAAVFAVGSARYLGLSRAAALVPGIAFPLLPDHFFRATIGHFSLSSIWAVSLGMLVVVSLLRRPRLAGRRRIWFEVAMLTACVVIGLTNAYWATFTALLVAAAGLGGALALRSWRVLVVGIGRGLALIVPILVGLRIDSMFLPQPAGYASIDVTRTPGDAEYFAGKIAAMLLPFFAHRVDELRILREQYDLTFPAPAERPSIGLVAGIGFVALVLWALLHFFRNRPQAADPRVRALAGLMIFALLAYNVGGIGTAWSLALDGGGLRVWSRMHVYIALLALLAVGIGLDRLARRTSPSVRLGAVAVLVAVILFDQTTPWIRPDVDRAEALRGEMEGFTSAVAANAGSDAMVYQAPQINFPVAQVDVQPASQYDGFLPYLYSAGTDLRWSFGGLQGDPHSDWQVGLGTMPFARSAVLLQAAGFDGVVLDTGSTRNLPTLEAEVLGALGQPEVVSTSARWQFFPLDLALPSACRSPEVTEELASMAVRPPMLFPGDGLDTQLGAHLTEVGGETAVLRVVTLREGGWHGVDVAFHIDSLVNVVVTFPDGSQQEVPPGPANVTWSGSVTDAETEILLQPTAAAPSYKVQNLNASAVPSARAADCLPEPPPPAAPAAPADAPAS